MSLINQCLNLFLDNSEIQDKIKTYISEHILTYLKTKVRLFYLLIFIILILILMTNVCLVCLFIHFHQ